MNRFILWLGDFNFLLLQGDEKYLSYKKNWGHPKRKFWIHYLYSDSKLSELWRNRSLNCSLDHCAGLETQPLMELLEQHSINLWTQYNYCLCWPTQFYLWSSAAFINPYIMWHQNLEFIFLKNVFHCLFKKFFFTENIRFSLYCSTFAIVRYNAANSIIRNQFLISYHIGKQ